MKIGINIYSGPFTLDLFYRAGFRVYDEITPTDIQNNINNYWILKVDIPSDATVLAKKGIKRCNKVIAVTYEKINIAHFPGTVDEILTEWPSAIRYLPVTRKTEDLWILCLLDNPSYIRYADFPTKTMQCMAVAAKYENIEEISELDEILKIYTKDLS